MPLVDVFTDPENDAIFESLGADRLEVDCLLGWGFLRAQSLTIDYAAARLRVGRARRDSWAVDDAADLGAPVHVPFDDTSTIPLVTADVAGLRIPAAVDTGATFVHLEPGVYDALDPQPEVQAGLANTVDGVVTADVGQVATVALAGAEQTEVWFATNPSAQLASFREEGLEIEGVIGTSFLLGYVATFDRGDDGLTLQAYPSDVRQALIDELIEDVTAR